LAELGPDAAKMLPDLRKALADADSRVRVKAADLVWRLAKDEVALRTLIDALHDPNKTARSDAAGTLGISLGAAAEPAVPALIRALWDQDNGVRDKAAEALGRIGPAARAAVPALIVALKTPGDDDAAYSSTAEALGLIGPAAKEAAPFLKEKLQHPDGYVRVCAALALWHIEDSRAGLAAARAALEDRSCRARAVAAEVLWRMEKHPQAVPTLIRLLEEDEGEMTNNAQYMAARALGRIGPAARAAVPKLRRLLNDKELELRQTVAAALKQIER
jgi:HEAT repeat protein